MIFKKHSDANKYQIIIAITLTIHFILTNWNNSYFSLKNLAKTLLVTPHQGYERVSVRFLIYEEKKSHEKFRRAGWPFQ